MGNVVVSELASMDIHWKLPATAGRSDGKVIDWQEWNLLGNEASERK